MRARGHLALHPLGPGVVRTDQARAVQRRRLQPDAYARSGPDQHANNDASRAPGRISTCRIARRAPLSSMRRMHGGRRFQHAQDARRAQRRLSVLGGSSGRARGALAWGAVEWRGVKKGWCVGATVPAHRYSESCSKLRPKLVKEAGGERAMN